MLGQRLHVEADRFLTRESVKVAANRVHFARNVLRGPRARAFEDHVFDEMRDAVDLGRLAARAGLDPDTHRHGAEMIHSFGENDQAVRQYGATKIAFGIHSHDHVQSCAATVQC